MYHGNDYDIAGFVLVSLKNHRLSMVAKLKAGDALIALSLQVAPHSNGYSLIRKILEVSGACAETTPLGDTSLADDKLLAPTRIYVKSLLSLIENVDIHTQWHILLAVDFGKIFRACYLKIRKLVLIAKVGSGLRSLTGYNRRVMSALMKCIVPLTVVSAY